MGPSFRYSKKVLTFYKHEKDKDEMKTLTPQLFLSMKQYTKEQFTQDVREVIELSESTLYPVLRRLQKDECLSTYDKECAGRNRRYYRITEKGITQLQMYETEWINYSSKITSVFEGGITHE